MSTVTEIQAAIEKLSADEKSALAASLQSQEGPIMSAALLARLTVAQIRQGVRAVACDTTKL